MTFPFFRISVRAFGVVAASLLGWLTALGQADHEMPPTPVAAQGDLAAAPAVEIARGKTIFESHCVMCHGPEGAGDRGPPLAQPVLPRASTDQALLRIVAEGIAGTEMPKITLEPEEIRAVAAYVRALGRRPVEPVPGDPLAGERLYADRGGCVLCHSIAGRGGGIGPDLTTIGLQRSAAHLRKALLEPAAEVPKSFVAIRSDSGLPDNYLFVRAVTKSGETIAGVRLNEDPFSIQLRDLGGKIHSLEKSELAELHKDWGFSPMPSYAGAFTSGELDDLVAYLVSLRGKK